MTRILDSIFGLVAVVFLVALGTILVAIPYQWIKDSKLEMVSARILSQEMGLGLPLEICFNAILDDRYVAHVVIETQTDLVLESSDYFLAPDVLESSACHIRNIGVWMSLNKRVKDPVMWQRIKDEVVPGNIRRLFVEFSRQRQGSWHFDPGRRISSIDVLYDRPTTTTGVVE